MKIVITILDYGVGNVKSIQNALEKVNVEVQLSNERDVIIASDGIILPGVGAFSHGMDSLHEYGLSEIIYDYVETGKPLLGICLGMQMLLSESEEFGLTKGLNLIPGKVVKIPVEQSSSEKLPHVSWNEIKSTGEESWNKTILEGLRDSEDMYFVHSFIVEPENTDYILSRTNYAGYEFCSTVKLNNIFGCQFHPEKSADAGLKILENFVKIARNNKNG